MLLAITASMGVLIIVYSLVRHFFGIGLSEATEKYVFDVVIITALGCYMYNRKLAKEERQAKEAALASQAEEEEASGSDDSPEEELSIDEENLPHWERKKRNEDTQ